MKRFFGFGFLIASILLGGTASADTCYDDTYQPAHVDCAKNDSKSADFTSGCAFKPATIVKTEVTCPILWVPELSDCKSGVIMPAYRIGASCQGAKRPTTSANLSLVPFTSGERLANPDPGMWVTGVSGFYYCLGEASGPGYGQTQTVVAYICQVYQDGKNSGAD